LIRVFKVRTMGSVDLDLQKKREERRALALLLLIAASIRVLFWVGLGRALDSADAVHYVEMGRQFASGDFKSFDPRLPVLYPLLGAFVHVLIPDLETACRLVSLLCSTVVVLPVYLLSTRLHGLDAACMAGLIVATSPWLAD